MYNDYAHKHFTYKSPHLSIYIDCLIESWIALRVTIFLLVGH